LPAVFPAFALSQYFEEGGFLEEFQLVSGCEVHFEGVPGWDAALLEGFPQLVDELGSLQAASGHVVQDY